MEAVAARIDNLLVLPQDEKEAGVQAVFDDLAQFTAESFLRNYRG